MKNEKIIRNQELDLNLYHLWCAIEDVKRWDFPQEIEEKLENLYWLVDGVLFKKIPHNYDILDEKCILITRFVKPNFKRKGGGNCE